MASKHVGTRFQKMQRDYSKSIGQDVVDNINQYWGLQVAHVGNDYAIHTNGQLVYGVPAIASHRDSVYKHDDIVYVRWDEKSLQLTRWNRR